MFSIPQMMGWSLAWALKVIIAAADAANVAMIFTGNRHFRH